MAKIYPQAFFDGKVLPLAEANLSIASSAVLYGLSVYTVFQVRKAPDGCVVFRLPEHWRRLVNSARIIGIDLPEGWDEERFRGTARAVIEANDITENVFIRASIHVTEPLPGVRSRGLATTMSMFVYDGLCILPKEGARLKTSAWRRVPDTSIPSRAKVNGAYVNSVLARQDALDSGYNDCVFLDAAGHVCELSAANLFIVRDGILHTPERANDILEGISRRTVLELAKDLGIETRERSIDMTELYIADEVFASGTSAYLTPVAEIDKRIVGTGAVGPITQKLQEMYTAVLNGELSQYTHFLSKL